MVPKLKKPAFTKKDLTEAVRRLAPGNNLSSSSETQLASFSVATIDAATKSKGAQGSSPLALMEWGVNFNARKFNELRTSADRKAGQLKQRLDTLRALKIEHEALERMLSPESPEAIKIADLLAEIQRIQDASDAKLHYRRRLEQMLRRLHANEVAFGSHLGTLDEARHAALGEHKDMKTMMRQIEAGHTHAHLEHGEAQRLATAEREERARAAAARRTEAEQAARMDEWRVKREVSRREFQLELQGDLSAEQEEALQRELQQAKAQLKRLLAQHEVLQREAVKLESDFMIVRQATGVNSQDEVVEKFLGQQGNRVSLDSEKREAEQRLNNAKKTKEENERRFSELKASGIGSTEMNREIAEQLEREITAARVELKASNAGCERLESVLVALRQGALGLYQRLRPFGHLLEGEGQLPIAAMIPNQLAAQGGGAGQHSQQQGSASSQGGQHHPQQGVFHSAGSEQTLTIDSIDAIHLSEIMLSKMVEIISGGEHGGAAAGQLSLLSSSSEGGGAGPSPSSAASNDHHRRRLLTALDETSACEDEGEDELGDHTLPHPQNNVRVRSHSQRREADQRALRAPQGCLEHDDGNVNSASDAAFNENDGGPCDADGAVNAVSAANNASSPPQGSSSAVADSGSRDDDAEDGLQANLAQAAANDLDDVVPSRNFLKLSSERQHAEVLRKKEQAAQKEKMLERMATAAENEKEQMSSRTARKKAQSEANNRLSTKTSGHPTPLSKTKDSALDRSLLFLTQVPELS